MGAYNWIVIEGECPSCGKRTSLRCRTHVASSYEGDGRGRFYDRVYKLRDEMLWWSDGDSRQPSWRVDGKASFGKDDPSIDYEACHCSCPNCKSSLCAVIKFQRNTPLELVELRSEAEWPEEYYR